MKYDLLLLLVFCAVIHGEKHDQEPQFYHSGSVQFSPDLIPLVTESMPVYELREAVVASQDFLSSIIENIAPDITFGPPGYGGALTAYFNDTLVAFIDPINGESGVLPFMEPLTPSGDLAEKAKTIAIRLAANETLFPRQDYEKIVVLDPITLARSISVGQTAASAIEETLAYTRFQRYVNEYPVVGPSTRAMIAVAGDSSIHGFAHRWRPFSPSNITVAPYSRDKIAKTIFAQASISADLGQNITVDNVTVMYYDGGPNFLQPVYRWEATVRSSQPPNPKIPTGTIRRFGYVSIGEASEFLVPVCDTQVEGPLPAYPFSPFSRDSQDALKLPSGLETDSRVQVKIGRYVDRYDNVGWINSAISFWNELLVGAVSSNRKLHFIDSQYYWAYPFEFLKEKNSYINTVNIALNEVHGDWNFFWTLSNTGDSLNLTNVDAVGGYGRHAGGSLAYWILHSCEVIPTQTDESTSFDVWWGIFRGIHSVMGYRTEMWICDGVTTDFGRLVGRGAPIVSSWFHAVAACPYYGAGDSTYYDGNRNIWEPMGRPSSVSVCGHVDDTAANIEGLRNPWCLIEHWFNN